MLTRVFKLIKYLLHISGIRKSYYWEGVYSEINQVPIRKKGFESNIISKRNSDYVENLLLNDKKSFIPYDSSTDEALLSFLVSAVSARNEHISIIDFGGGPGISFYHLTRSLVKEVDVTYFVIETDSMCRYSEKLYEGNNAIKFLSSIPEHVDDLKIVYISSVLQYINDYSALLKRLSSLNPQYILLAKTSCGEFETYFTKQINEKDCELKYSFINIHDIIRTMNTAGYSLIHKSVQQRFYDQTNFPSDLRMLKTSNLLFERLKKLHYGRIT